MAQATTDVSFQTTTPAIFAHPNLIVPKKFKGSNGKEKGEAKFSLSLVLASDNPDLPGMKAAIVQAAKQKWPEKDIKALAKAGELKLPFTSGDKLIEKRKAKLAAAGKEYTGDADYQAGCTVFKSSSQFPVGLAVAVNGNMVDMTEDNKAVLKNAFYFGTYGLAKITFRAYDGVDGGKDGVTGYLDLALSLNKGKKLTTGRSAAEAFKGVAGAASMEDPTEGETEQLADESEDL